MTNTPRGFTLIELLVVISVISLISSVIFSQVAIARTKSIDTAKKAELSEVRTALRTFHLDKGRMPHNYDCTGTCVADPMRTTVAIEDTVSPENPVTESGKAYRASMLELVNAGYLPRVPKSPGGAGYSYYDYGPYSLAGAVIATTLTSETPSATGPTGSCRPFTTAYEAPSGGGMAAPLGDWIACQLGEILVGDECVMGGVPPIDVTKHCLYEQDGLLVEGVCPTEDNLCSTSVSRDFCLCNQY